jgi:hypothetical protein
LTALLGQDDGGGTTTAGRITHSLIAAVILDRVSVIAESGFDMQPAGFCHDAT